MKQNMHHENMNCMEVWGGDGARSHRISRPGLDVWIWSDPRSCSESGGGDLHLISSCASGRITRMLLADVCGFGSLFADISSELRGLLKRNVNRIKQSRAVREMSCRLDEASHRGGFASTLISTYFAPTRSFSLCNAGHPPPFFYRAADAKWSVFKEAPLADSRGRAALGVVDPSEYQQFRTQLEIGDMVLSYSNALTECRGSDGGTIGLNGLLERVQELDPTSPAEIGSALAERMRDEFSENLANEDATVLLCQATNTPVAWQDNLLAPFRLLRAATDRTSIS